MRRAVRVSARAKSASRELAAPQPTGPFVITGQTHRDGTQASTSGRPSRQCKYSANVDIVTSAVSVMSVVITCASQRVHRSRGEDRSGEDRVAAAEGAQCEEDVASIPTIADSATGAARHIPRRRDPK